MKTPIPEGHYIKKLEINDTEIEVEFLPKKKIGLLMICLNERYWPYLAQVLQDCKTHFLPHHNVEPLIWTDLPENDTPEFKEHLNKLLTESQLTRLRQAQASTNGQYFSRESIEETVKYVRGLKEKTIFETAPIEWPAPTLMRYHLFMQQEEKLKEYDYLFYLDVDMRVVDKISDEIMGEGLTAAEHPMYSLRPQYIPPYEPNRESEAYIPRLGKIEMTEGKPRFKPLYLAGGFQGGVAKQFIEAMRVLRDNIDKDFNRNYTAIWNDESHWNKYVLDHANPAEGHPTIVLDVSYVYPDSLIKEYYEPVWGRSYTPKIITLTKPFTLSKAAGKALNEFLGKSTAEPFTCPTCGDKFTPEGMKVLKVVTCPGFGKPHQLDLQKL